MPAQTNSAGHVTTTGLMLFALFFAAVVVLACLTTSTGLLSAWSSYASAQWPRAGFGTQLVAGTLVGFCLANLGLDLIVTIVSPVTLLLYPVAITLVAVTLVDALAPGHLRAAYRWGSVCAGLLGLVSALSSLGVTAPSALLARTGLWNDETGWIVPTLACVVAGVVIDVAGGRWSTPARDRGMPERFLDEGGASVVTIRRDGPRHER
ncbi:branched-chain amino acid transport system II carrier protein [Propionibacterium australiense]|uniref:Branched-chain amino acid transport system II carrier protein n=1 Tax=Propionibacterium australiense TaxID=119981 RepID=A0A383S9D6_9ACTN|nr:branched-chain amino acid transport system II carrier protein [Propionibacterium australiense]SYZ34645.1 Branched-chain amino acid transport system II carrier protein [Propionibacterium australiense]VEH91742.1 branched-chain amino acid transport system 2 carrier protein BrnQ [Propionibacterium australiense]